MSEETLRMISDAKRVSTDHLHSLGIKDDLSNAVALGTIGSLTIENERVCPDYLEQFSEGWWFAHYCGHAEYFVVNLVPAFGESMKQVTNALAKFARENT